jgi:hypothetical protein
VKKVPMIPSRYHRKNENETGNLTLYFGEKNFKNAFFLHTTYYTLRVYLQIL